MGTKDLLEKHLFSYNDVFASAWNEIAPDSGIVQKWFDAGDLIDAPTETVAMLHSGILQRHRDIFKYAGSAVGLNIAMFGLENQTTADRDMTMRIMMYDAISYWAQNKNRKADQNPVPVFTRVLYFGYTEPWNAPRKLSDRLKVPDRFRAHFQDYAIDVIELAWLSDSQIDRLSGDLKALAVCLRKFRLKELDHWPDTEIAHVPEVLNLLGAITGNSFFSNIKDDYASHCGRVKMCEMFEKYNAGLIAIGEERGEERGIAIGEERGIAIGEERGIAIGEETGKKLGMAEKALVIAKNLLDMRMPQSDIAKATGLPIEEVRQLAASGACS